MFLLKLTVIMMILVNLFNENDNRNAGVLIIPPKNILTRKEYFEKIRRCRRNGNSNTTNKR